MISFSHTHTITHAKQVTQSLCFSIKGGQTKHQQSRSEQEYISAERTRITEQSSGN